jgi:hypothetical protein
MMLTAIAADAQNPRGHGDEQPAFRGRALDRKHFTAGRDKVDIVVFD